MKFINLSVQAEKNSVLEAIKNNELVNKNVSFDPKKGKPVMKIKEKGDKIRITCELTERATKDNGFLVGTFFIGRIKEKSGYTTLRGVALTAPIYHLLFFLMFIAAIAMFIKVGGFSVIPLIAIVFDIFLFKDEFRKQGYIKRYLERAFKRVNRRA